MTESEISLHSTTESVTRSEIILAANGEVFRFSHPAVIYAINERGSTETINTENSECERRIFVNYPNQGNIPASGCFPDRQTSGCNKRKNSGHVNSSCKRPRLESSSEDVHDEDDDDDEDTIVNDSSGDESEDNLSEYGSTETHERRAKAKCSSSNQTDDVDDDFWIADGQGKCNCNCNLGTFESKLHQPVLTSTSSSSSNHSQAEFEIPVRPLPDCAKNKSQEEGRKCCTPQVSCSEPLISGTTESCSNNARFHSGKLQEQVPAAAQLSPNNHVCASTSNDNNNSSSIHTSVITETTLKDLETETTNTTICEPTATYDCKDSTKLSRPVESFHCVNSCLEAVPQKSCVSEVNQLMDCECNNDLNTIEYSEPQAIYKNPSVCQLPVTSYPKPHTCYSQPKLTSKPVPSQISRADRSSTTSVNLLRAKYSNNNNAELCLPQPSASCQHVPCVSSELSTWKTTRPQEEREGQAYEVRSPFKPYTPPILIPAQISSSSRLSAASDSSKENIFKAVGNHDENCPRHFPESNRELPKDMIGGISLDLLCVGVIFAALLGILYLYGHYLFTCIWYNLPPFILFFIMLGCILYFSDPESLQRQVKCQMGVAFPSALTAGSDNAQHQSDVPPVDPSEPRFIVPKYPTVCCLGPQHIAAQ